MSILSDIQVFWDYTSDSPGWVLRYCLDGSEQPLEFLHSDRGLSPYTLACLARGELPIPYEEAIRINVWAEHEGSVVQFWPQWDSETMVTALQTRLRSQAIYQAAVLGGKASLSGADLKGRARQFSGRYAASRRAVADLWIEYGGHIRRGPHGRLTLEAGDPPDDAKKTQCSAGSCWQY